MDGRGKRQGMTKRHLSEEVVVSLVLRMQST